MESKNASKYAVKLILKFGFKTQKIKKLKFKNLRDLTLKNIFLRQKCFSIIFTFKSKELLYERPERRGSLRLHEAVNGLFSLFTHLV